jgi:activator of HSP90 ATPase
MTDEMTPAAAFRSPTRRQAIMGGIPNQRIVQAWRPTHWESGLYSLVKFELKPQASETRIILDHTGFPPGEFESLNTGWKPRYWDPMQKFLAQP